MGEPDVSRSTGTPDPTTSRGASTPDPKVPDPYCALPIPRLPNVPELRPELQARVDRGADPLEARQLGWAGDHYTRWLSFIQPLRWKGSVEFRTQEIARLRVARLNQCHY